MNIKILDSWLREHLKTDAKPEEIARTLSLTSVSVEKIEKYGNDFLYEIEITTNRPDLFSILGIAREAAAVLPQFGIKAKFIPLTVSKPKGVNNVAIEIVSDQRLVNRVCAVVMTVGIGKSPKLITERLEASGIRSLNNVIDVTNYVMRVIGHPAHVFDFDRLKSNKLIIREAKKGEKIQTLDKKNYVLNGGEIIAENGDGVIVDLLGIMGLENSVVTEKTKRILYFIDNNEPSRIRSASMSLGIRTEAAVLNEKTIDPELAEETLYYGIKLFEENANGEIISQVLDIYPNKPKPKQIEVSFEKINQVIGIDVDPKKIAEALRVLGFEPKLSSKFISVKIPSFRLADMEFDEDVIEEIARIYGYHNLPSILPPTVKSEVTKPFADNFYWEDRTKKALKYWGFTETYTYSFVSEDMFEGPLEDAVTVDNPLTEDFVYMRNSLIPSLLKVSSDNKNFTSLKIFEIANVYVKNGESLPNEILTLSGVIKNEKINFFEIKGIIEQLLFDLGIKNLNFKKSKKVGTGASLYIGNDYLGEIEVLDVGIADFELNFQLILENANLKKEFRYFAKYPPIIEDLSIVIEKPADTEELIDTIKSQSNIIAEASLKDIYDKTKTFHIIYQDLEKNLTKEDVAKIREKIISSLKSKFSARIK